MKRQDYINKASSYEGTREGSYKHKEIVTAYNSITPLPAGYQLKMTDSWCAGFVSACAWSLDAGTVFPYECSVARMVEIAKKKKLWIEDESIKPRVGWLIIYDWQDSGLGDNGGYPDHVGIIRKVTSKYIYTIEGNYSDMVRERKIEINGKYIRGFIAVKFDKDGYAKSNLTIAREVIEGKWGNGQERRAKLTDAGYNPDTIQRLVNKLLK